MRYEIEETKAKEFFEIIEYLETLLTERISDMHEIKGLMQARHAYIFYRKLLWEAKYLLKDNLKEPKTKEVKP
jgi:hypothetical protein